jgi:ketosteroid isomerase-like protein
MSLRAPSWADPLLATDVTPTTGGRAQLAAEGIPLSVRVTIVPLHGGIARVIRYDQRADAGSLALRRFTGHPSTGFWLWASDAPRITAVPTAQRTELANLARAAGGGVAATLSNTGDANQVCAGGEEAFVEIVVDGRSVSFTRPCLGGADAVGRLALRLSEIAGSRTEEELAAASVAELMDADRAFAAAARADGVPAAFARYAASDALMVSKTTLSSGSAGVAQRFNAWPQGARLEWAPETGRVSARGDMGWTWGNSTLIAADGTRTAGRYISVWTRDLDGNWRFAFDAGIE